MSPAYLGTEVGLGRLTEDTRRFAALGCVAWDDVVTRLDGRHAMADALHDASRLMSEDAREEPLLEKEENGVHIRKFIEMSTKQLAP